LPFVELNLFGLLCGARLLLDRLLDGLLEAVKLLHLDLGATLLSLTGRGHDLDRLEELLLPLLLLYLFDLLLHHGVCVRPHRSEVTVLVWCWL